MKLQHDQCYINGQWVGGDATFEVTNPANGKVIARVPDLGTAETRDAIAHAHRAQPAWGARPARERAAVLRRWCELMLANQEALAILMTTEQGKPLAEARAEVGYGASFLEWFAEEAKRIYGETVPSSQTDKRLLVIKQPIGVCVAITPWNFPIAMITRKVAPALAAGCTMVVKPAEQTPLSALALCELAAEAGVPPGVLNVITGDAKTIGAEMTSNAHVRHLSFTGSTEVGRLLMEQCAGSVIKVALELGGNAPFIVFEDAAVDAAVAGAMVSKYRNGGQTCVSSNRIYVHDKVYDQFATKLAAAVADISVGDGMDEGAVQGPLIDADAVEKVEDHLADALAKGAQLKQGGERHALGGTYFQPTVLTEVTADMKVAREETFGPLAPLFRFTDEDDVVRMANDTEYGLAAYFYSQDLARVWRVAEALDYGMVGVNTGIMSTAEAPFGGVKQSGIGREGSRHGIEEYLEMKYLCIGGLA